MFGLVQRGGFYMLEQIYKNNMEEKGTYLKK